MNKKVIHQNFILSVLSLIIFLCAVPTTVHAQDARVTIKLEDASLEQAIREIERQTKYLFNNTRDVDMSRRITVDLRDVSVSEVLEQVLKGSGVIYRQDGVHITLLAEPKSPEQAIDITGVVTDDKNIPVIGASVTVKGTGIGVSTNIDGSFSIHIPSANDQTELTVEYLGYESASIPVRGRTYIEVTLSEEAVEVEQVVVTALGIKRSEKALSYNVQQVLGEELTMIKDANFINSLNGKVAGVTINSSSSGVGGASKVVLRGAKSINSSSNALYVIDGIPMYNFGGGGDTEFGSTGATESIADINPDDIESISVLTGASAAALYGSSAANGAIMITTKRGEAGRFKVSLSSSNDFSRPFMLPEFQNRYGTGRSGFSDRSPIQSWGPKLSEAAQTGYQPADFFETGFVTSNSVAISGGTEQNQTFFSVGSVNSKGMIPNNEYNRYNFTFRNVSSFANDKLKLDVSASYIVQDDINMINQGVYSNPIVPVYLFPRGDDFSTIKIFERYDPARKMRTQYWPQGEGNLRMQNPYWISYRNPRENDKKRYMLSAGMSWAITDWLELSGRARVDNSNNLFTQKLWATTNEVLTEGSKNGHYTEARRYDTQTYADVMLNVNKRFGDDFSFVGVLGASINDAQSDELSYRGPIRDEGLANVFNVFDLDPQKKKARKEGWHEQTQSVFASLELGWRSMLYLTATGRNDWASQLAGSPQTSFFYPSVGLSWIPTATFDMPDAFSYLKLRGSFSSVGTPFPRYLTVYTRGYNENTQIWDEKKHFPIGQLYPERTRTLEFGVDARLWNNFSLNVSWYRADTYNQTFNPDISVSPGYSNIYVQTGHVRNMGVEASLGYDNRWNNFRWSSGFTFSWNKNEVIDLLTDYKHPETGDLITKNRLQIKGLGKANYILKLGGTLGDLYSNSDLRRDENGMVFIDDAGNLSTVDNLDDILLGSVFPTYNLAWNNTFSWKGLSLSALVTARIGGVVYSATRAYMDEYGVSEATAAARDAGGVLLNQRILVDPQAYYSAIGAQSGIPQYYTYSATNVRLQEVSLSYGLPKKWFKDKMSMSLSVFGRNLWMIYCKAPIDPESVASTENYYQGIDYFMIPSSRNIGCSIKIQF